MKTKMIPIFDMYRIEPGYWFEGENLEAAAWLKDAEEFIGAMVECADLSTADRYKAKDILAALEQIRIMLEDAEIIVEGEEA